MNRAQALTILWVDESADDAEIKAAYKKWAQIFHPDKDTGNADWFKRVKTAYDFLLDNKPKVNLDESAKAFITKSFIEAITVIKDRPDVDVVTSILSAWRKTREDSIAQKNALTGFILHCTKVRDRVNCEDENDENLFVAAVDSQITIANESIDNIEKTIEIGNRLIFMLEKYRDNPERLGSLSIYFSGTSSDPWRMS